MNYFIHERADVASKAIGEGTKIWQFSVVLSGAKIGKNCNINCHCFLENDVILGDNVTVKSGVQLWDGARIGDNVFIGPNVSFTNDQFPRSKKYPDRFLPIEIGSGASIGAGAVLLPGIQIGANAMVGAGSVVLKSVPANAIVAGNPARIVGYVNSRSSTGSAQAQPGVTEISGPQATSVNGVTVHYLPRIQDIRGSLSVGEFERQVPFSVKRYFLVYNVPSRETRGEHAHKACHQFLLCIRGSCAVVVDDGKAREEINLEGPETGLYIPPMIWGIQYKYSSDAMLLVFASDYYDASDYIRSYDEFCQLKESARDPVS